MIICGMFVYFGCPLGHCNCPHNRSSRRIRQMERRREMAQPMLVATQE